MTSRKSNMLRSLPLRDGALLLRQWTREDMDLLTAWPEYPFPYETFRFSFCDKTPEERDAVFRARQEDEGRICLVADQADAWAVGYLALMDVDWDVGIVGNVGFRVHPDWCDRGIGTAALGRAAQWAFEGGLKTIRLDVAASNARAVRCYEKVGFVKYGELWREAPDLGDADLSQPKYDFLRAHVDFERGSPKLRFWLMELRAE